jgi:hypothetical protein
LKYDDTVSFVLTKLPFTEKINYRKQLDATQNAT